MASDSTRLDYRNKVILAPMVRIGTLPTRLLALKYGADIVYCEEIIDHKILSTQRIENDVLGTVDFVHSDGTLVFRTHPSEKDRLVFQLGTANAQTALRAAKKVEKDVAGIDVNMGCPKEFSIKGGMGAALLKKPDKVKEILTTLVNGVSIPVTCKIRLLPREEDSVTFAKMVESTGIAALAVHGRLTEERPRHPNRNHTIRKIAEALTIPVIANGGSKVIKAFDDIEPFRLDTGATSVMVARSAEWNMSVLRKAGKLPVKDVVLDYLKIAIDTDNGFPNTKYCILMTMHADMQKQQGQDTQESKCLEDICEIWGMTDYMKEVREKNKQKSEAIDKYHGIKYRKTEEGKMLIEMPVRYIKKDYDSIVSPKLRLFEWIRRNDLDKPIYVTHERPEDRVYKSVLEVEGKKYTASYWEKSKQLAEQAAAIVCLIVIGEDDGKKPGSDNPNDKIAQVWQEKFGHVGDIELRHKAAAPGVGGGDISASGETNGGAESTGMESGEKTVGTESTGMESMETTGGAESRGMESGETTVGTESTGMESRETTGGAESRGMESRETTNASEASSVNNCDKKEVLDTSVKTNVINESQCMGDKGTSNTGR